MRSQITAELTVHVPPGSPQSPSEVCLIGTWAWKVISPPQPVASLEEIWDHNQLKLFKKTEVLFLCCIASCHVSRRSTSTLCSVGYLLFCVHLVLQGLGEQVGGEQGHSTLDRNTLCLSHTTRLSWMDWSTMAAFPGMLKLYPYNFDEMGSPASPCLQLKSVIGEHMM